MEFCQSASGLAFSSPVPRLCDGIYLVTFQGSDLDFKGNVSGSFHYLRKVKANLPYKKQLLPS